MRGSVAHADPAVAERCLFVLGAPGSPGSSRPGRAVAGGEGKE